jgi:hypothetical protein
MKILTKYFAIKLTNEARCRWLKPEILAIWEVEIGRIVV